MSKVERIVRASSMLGWLVVAGLAASGCARQYFVETGALSSLRSETDESLESIALAARRADGGATFVRAVGLRPVPGPHPVGSTRVAGGRRHGLLWAGVGLIVVGTVFAAIGTYAWADGVRSNDACHRDRAFLCLDIESAVGQMTLFTGLGTLGFGGALAALGGVLRSQEVEAGRRGWHYVGN